MHWLNTRHCRNSTDMYVPLPPSSRTRLHGHVATEPLTHSTPCGVAPRRSTISCGAHLALPSPSLLLAVFCPPSAHVCPDPVPACQRVHGSGVTLQGARCAQESNYAQQAPLLHLHGAVASARNEPGASRTQDPAPRTCSCCAQRIPAVLRTRRVETPGAWTAWSLRPVQAQRRSAC
ncbi:hypothetical protein DFH06DRAFT_156270 [Mycena polygramma]|nr:hypothetical protein DFH06DRAFT_156270 [Mycena polygramma]